MNLKKLILARIARPKFRYITSNEVSSIETDDFSLKRKILRELNFTEIQDNWIVFSKDFEKKIEQLNESEKKEEQDKEKQRIKRQFSLLVSMCKKITLSPVEKVMQEGEAIQEEQNFQQQDKAAALVEKIMLKSLKYFDLEMLISSYDWKMIEDAVEKDQVVEILNKKFSDVKFIDENDKKIIFKISKEQAQNILEMIIPPSGIYQKVKNKPKKESPKLPPKNDKNKKLEKIKNVLKTKNKKEKEKDLTYFKKDLNNILKVLELPKDLRDFEPLMDQITLSKNNNISIYIKDNNFNKGVSLLKKKQSYNNKFPKNLRSKLKNFSLDIKEKTILIKFDINPSEAAKISELKSTKISKIIASVLKKFNGYN
jgi:hypothetical protein